MIPEAEAEDSEEANVIPDELDEFEGRKELLDEMVKNLTENRNFYWCGQAGKWCSPGYVTNCASFYPF